MKTICVYLNDNYADALQKVLNSIPCFINFEKDNSVSIRCREEDAAFVERQLQEYV